MGASRVRFVHSGSLRACLEIAGLIRVRLGSLSRAWGLRVHSGFPRFSWAYIGNSWFFWVQVCSHGSVLGSTCSFGFARDLFGARTGHLVHFGARWFTQEYIGIAGFV